MGPKPQIVKTLEESKQELLETTVLQEKLSKIQGQLEKTFDESRVKYTKRVAKISDELAKILGKENQIQTSEPPLLKAVLRKTIERLTEKKTQLENRIADYEQDLTGVNERLIHRQMVDRDTNSPFTYKPLRSYFPERRSASVNRNNPYDLFQATFGHEKEYTYLDRASLQEMSESSGTEVDTLKQAAIKYVPVDIDKVSLTTWHKLGKHNTFTTHKALLNNVSVYQLNEDISYLKEVLLSTQPLERLNKKTTWRVQLCNHPDHA